MTINKRVKELEQATSKADPEGFPQKVKVIWMDQNGEIETGYELLSEKEYKQQNPQDLGVWVNWGKGETDKE